MGWGKGKDPQMGELFFFLTVYNRLSISAVFWTPVSLIFKPTEALRTPP